MEADQWLPGDGGREEWAGGAGGVCYKEGGETFGVTGMFAA